MHAVRLTLFGRKAAVRADANSIVRQWCIPGNKWISVMLLLRQPTAALRVDIGCHNWDEPRTNSKEHTVALVIGRRFAGYIPTGC